MADRMTSVVVERIRVSKLNVAISVAKLGSTDGQSLQWYTKGHLTVFLVAVNKADDMHQEGRADDTDALKLLPQFNLRRGRKEIEKEREALWLLPEELTFSHSLSTAPDHRAIALSS